MYSRTLPHAFAAHTRGPGLEDDPSVVAAGEAHHRWALVPCADKAVDPEGVIAVHADILRGRGPANPVMLAVVVVPEFLGHVIDRRLELLCI
jgi:hypothetical protein